MNGNSMRRSLTIGIVPESYAGAYVECGRRKDAAPMPPSSSAP